MSKLIELRERMAARLKDLDELHKKNDRSADDETRLDGLLAEVNDLGPAIEREQSLDAAAAQRAQYDAPGRSAARITGPASADPIQGRDAAQTIDRRTIGRRFVESDQFRQFADHGSRGKSEPLDVQSYFPRHRREMAQRASEGLEQRALVYGGNLPADYIAPVQVPGFFRGDDLQGTLRDVLINGQTTSNSIEFFRETTFTNNAAPVAEATATTGASGLKPESVIAFEQATANVVTIAHWIPITRATVQDAAQMQTYIEQRLIDGLRLAESNQLLNGPGTGATMTGLLNTTGIQVLDNTAASGYWATNPVADAGQDNEDFNRVLRAITLVQTVGRGMADFIVLNPMDMERFMTSTDANRQYFGGGPFSGTSMMTLWGLRVVRDEHIAAGNALIGDGRMAAVWDRMQAQILIDTINDQFVRNILTILAEERLALTVYRPAAFVHAELTTAA